MRSTAFDVGKFLANNYIQIEKFAERLDGAVAGQYLFDKRRAGARHSHDEDGSARRVAPTLARAEEFFRKQRLVVQPVGGEKLGIEIRPKRRSAFPFA
ncbi:MAG: hypothetical protein WDM89_21085 [Rhizomicrobium sp.]